MGTKNETWPTAALCLPAAGLTLLPVGEEGGDGSFYTEADLGPGVSVPGTADARLVPRVSGAQEIPCVLRVLQGGAPEVSAAGQGVELGFELDVDGTPRGWSPPTLAHSWQHLVWSGTTPNYNRYDIVTDPVTQRVVCVYHAASVGVGVYATTLDLAEGGTPGAVVTVRDDVTADAIALAADEDGVVYCLIVESAASYVYRSTDQGATWSLHAEDVFPAGLTVSNAAFAIGPTGALLLVTDGTDLRQYVSHDGLVSFDLIDDTVAGSHPRVVVQPDGTYVVGYLRTTADNHPCVRRLASAGAALSDASVVVIDADNKTTQVLVTEPDGLTWWIGASAGQEHRLQVAVSDDGGVSWTMCLAEAIKVDDGSFAFVSGLRACSAWGTVLLAHQWTSTETTTGSLAVLGLGGWGAVSSVPYTSPDQRTHAIVSRTGTGRRVSTAGDVDRRTWLPIQLPDNCGWIDHGAGTSASASGSLQITTTANARWFHQDFTDDFTLLGAIVDVIRDSGGALGSDDIAIGVRSGGAATGDAEIRVRLASGGLRLIDEASGSTLATDATVTTASWFTLAVMVSGTKAWVAVRDAAWSSGWRLIWDGTLTRNGSPTSTARLSWGHLASSTAQSRWRVVATTTGLTFATGQVGTTWDRVLGRPLGARPVPLPEVGGSGVAWLSIAAGLGVRDESYRVEPVSAYPVEALDPTQSASPAVTWRSTTTGTEAVIAWDTTNLGRWQGDSIALLAVNCNFREAVLEYYSGGFWFDAGTLDLATGGWDALDYDLFGDVLVGGSTTTVPDRYLQENELAGGWVWLGEDLGGGITLWSHARRIRSNTAGSWRSPGGASTQLARIFLEVEGDEPAAGVCAVLWPSGVLVVHRTSLTTSERWRVRIPANQPTLDSRYEAGLLHPCAIRGLGAPPDWGWSREAAPNVAVSTSRRGTPRASQLGPVLDRWTWGWPEGVPLDRHRLGTDLDYVGGPTGQPLATLNDVPWALRGYLEESAAGARPVVALASLPASGTTITDRTLWLYGLLEGAVRQGHVLGDDGVDELVRVETITVRGIP